MSAVLVEIAPRPLGEEEIQVIGDLDTVVETVMCNCSAGDDNPY
jgi:hypothetical protein